LVGKPHTLSEELVVWDSVLRKDNQKKILKHSSEKQGLKCPYEEAFYTETQQVMWSKM
jgi:hypothetical protein